MLRNVEKLRLRVNSITAVILLAAAMIFAYTLTGALALAQGNEGGKAQASALASDKLIYVVPAHQTIESGLEKFLERAYKDAAKNQADYIILDVDTLGGRIDSALDIGTVIRDSAVPTVAFIHGKAISAGSYISLNAQKIVMQQGSTIGAAAVVDSSGNEVESPKVIAAWAGEMKSAAELRGRNPDIAVKMVDKNAVLEIPQLGRAMDKGTLLSLTASEAVKVGYAEAIADTEKDVIAYLGLEGAQIVHVEPTFAERLARFLTDPVVTTFLLLIGIAGVAIEIFVPGFGLPGILGIAGFTLYFFGHYVAGFAGLEDIVLFLIGIVLLVVEIFVPGFGIWAIAGTIFLMSGVIMAAYDASSAAASLGIAFALAVVVAGIVIWYFRHRGIWNKFILRDELRTDLGYVSSSLKDHLLGKSGMAITPLRPAGSAMFGDERVDVVTRGEFIPLGSRITVIHAEGTRVVVKEEI